MCVSVSAEAQLHTPTLDALCVSHTHELSLDYIRVKGAFLYTNVRAGGGQGGEEKITSDNLWFCLHCDPV